MIERHDLEWTPQQIRDFWDYYSGNPAVADQYFAGLMGRSLLDYVQRRIRIGTAVDVGCGRGHLLKLMMKRGSDVYGADQSPLSVEEVRSELAGMPQFKDVGVGTRGLPDAIADTVFMVEVVEHLNETALTDALEEARRLLKPGGHLVLTTPNEENLDQAKIMCPDCGAVFHQMQHVRSWSATSLAERLSTGGFRCLSSEGTALTPYSGILNVIYRSLYFLRHRGRRPNLIYIGAKV